MFVIKNEGQPTEFASVELNGKEFQILKFKAIESMKLQATLLKKIGPAIASLIGVLMGTDKRSVNQEEQVEVGKPRIDVPGQGSLLDMDISEDALSNFVTLFFADLDESTLIQLIDKILTKTTCSTDNVLVSSATIDKIFGSNTFDIYKLVFDVLKYNFSDFLSLKGVISN